MVSLNSNLGNEGVNVPRNLLLLEDSWGGGIYQNFFGSNAFAICPLNISLTASYRLSLICGTQRDLSRMQSKLGEVWSET